MSLAISLSNDITASKKVIHTQQIWLRWRVFSHLAHLKCVCVKRLKTSNGRLLVKIPFALLRIQSCHLLISGYSFFPYIVNFHSQCVWWQKVFFFNRRPRTPPMRFAAEFLWWLRWRRRRRQGARCWYAFEHFSTIWKEHNWQLHSPRWVLRSPKREPRLNTSREFLLIEL